MATTMSKGALVVLEKLKKHPHYKGRNVPEGELLIQAQNLSDPEYIRCQFSYLLDPVNRIVTKTGTEDELDQGLTSLQTADIRWKDVDNLATAMNIPVKLVLKQLHQSRPPMANKLSQLLRCEYGPLHTILQVGEVTIEWGSDDLVIPDLRPRLPGDLETEIPKQTLYYQQTKQLTQALDDAERKRDRVEKFDVVFTSMSEKVKLIDRLVDVIVTYNCEKTYNLFKCNCQHFTRDALTALGYEDTIRFRGKMNDYFKQLKAGKLTVPDEYATHESLDDYVKANLHRITVPDMEYLLCQYFQHHLPSMRQMEGEDLDNWKCDVEDCQSEVLDLKVKGRSSFRVSKSPKTKAEEAQLEELQDDVPDELQLQDEATLEEQDRILKRITGGYRERVLYKLLHQPDEQLLRQDDIVEKLTERERFRDAFCTNIIEGVSEALVVETSADYQKKSDLPEVRARERAANRMKVCCNFPARLIMYCPKQKSSTLKAALQVGNYYFEWNKTNVIMPKKVEDFTSKQPILTLSVPQEGAWSSFVNELQPRITEALRKLDYDVLICLQYELAGKKDELLYALIDVCVSYNRNNAYRQKKCNNSHFIKDAQMALGVASPAKVSRTLQELMKKATQTWKKQQAGKKFENHGDLDQFMHDIAMNEALPQESLEYLMCRYFQFHTSAWEQQPDDKKGWSCAGLKCMLERVEDSVQLCMW